MKLTVSLPHAGGFKSGDRLVFFPLPPSWWRLFARLAWCWRERRLRPHRYLITSVESETSVGIDFDAGLLPARSARVIYNQDGDVVFFGDVEPL